MTKGIYIHIPFCKKKCNYCSFYSSTMLAKKEDFLKALEEEIEYKKSKYENFFKGKGDISLYIGGGNPSLFDECEIKRLFSVLKGLNCSFKEITMELNPDDVTINKLKLIKSIGVNRVSLGIQSFCNEVLNFLGRNHDSSTSLKVLQSTADLFENYSIDLIGGIPNLKRDWVLEFEFIKSFMPPHISFYLLSIEEGAKFYGKIKIDEDLQQKEYMAFCDFAAKLGYEHYEVSNFCQTGRYAKHNLLYWNRNDYLGFGPSAASFLKREKQRMKNISMLDEYIKTPNSYDTETLTERDVFVESLFLALRTSFGINLDKIKSEFPVLFKLVDKPIEVMKAKGYLMEKRGNLFIPERYMLVMNEIVLNIIKEI